jgi:large subunit ribosomal protein L3
MNLPGLIVRKVGMTRMVDAEGRMVPVTLVEATNQKITKILTPERDGYHAIQIGYFEKKESRLNKPDIHRLRKNAIAENFARFKEMRLEQPLEGAELGKALSVESLQNVKAVDVTGLNKGRGFQGAIKRHGSAIGRMTHGSMYHRRTGSIGSNTWPARVFKNKKMPGHMGTETTTIQNLSIMDVDATSNVIALKGSLPGHNNSYLVIRPSIKA